MFRRMEDVRWLSTAYTAAGCWLELGAVVNLGVEDGTLRAEARKDSAAITPPAAIPSVKPPCQSNSHQQPVPRSRQMADPKGLLTPTKTAQSLCLLLNYKVSSFL
ncbi:hypothetical protein KCU97_g26, partial [Aureobasidium melanogenum]